MAIKTYNRSSYIFNEKPGIEDNMSAEMVYITDRAFYYVPHRQPW